MAHHAWAVCPIIIIVSVRSRDTYLVVGDEAQILRLRSKEEEINLTEYDKKSP